jgi:micrococcal nuclease
MPSHVRSCRSALALLGLAALAAGCGAGTPTDAGRGAPAVRGAEARGSTEETVERVIDGDTLVLEGGERVRLIQIDTPETHGGTECYGEQASRELRRLLPEGAVVRVQGDPALDARDHYDRRLGYVLRGKVNANIEMVRRGAANVWFYRGERGRYERELMAARRAARTERRGLWRACPGATHQVTTGLNTGRP